MYWFVFQLRSYQVSDLAFSLQDNATPIENQITQDIMIIHLCSLVSHITIL